MIPRDAPILSVAAMRAAEQACGISPDELMERAATIVAREVARFAAGRPILVVAGPGNNGGDAFAAARLLGASGHDVVVAATEGVGQGAAAEMRARWTGAIASIADAIPRAVLVDGLFGIGLSRPIEPPLAEAMSLLATAAETVIAIDIPSGLAGDGTDLGAPVAAHLTVALGALKPAHVVGPFRQACGHVVLGDLGISAGGTARTIARPRLAMPGAMAHKYSRGMVAIVGGTMPGAARLAASGAAHGGAGYVVLCGDDARVPCDAIVHRPPGAVPDLLEDARIGAVVIGCGLGRGDDARATCHQVLASNRAVVLDGDALALFSAASIARRNAATVLTPHSGEFDALFGTGTGSGSGNKIDRTLAAARAVSAVIVHKGADTVIAAPDGRVVVAQPPRWLSTAGTGDVLAGLLGARLAGSGDSMQAAIEAVWLHARAAGLAGTAFVADGLAMHIPAAIDECR